MSISALRPAVLGVLEPVAFASPVWVWLASSVEESAHDMRPDIRLVEAPASLLVTPDENLELSTSPGELGVAAGAAEAGAPALRLVETEVEGPAPRELLLPMLSIDTLLFH